jgi:hypothetical protein
VLHLLHVGFQRFPPSEYSEPEVERDYDAVRHDLLFEQWYTWSFPPDVERHVPVLAERCVSGACRSSTIEDWDLAVPMGPTHSGNGVLFMGSAKIHNAQKYKMEKQIVVRPAFFSLLSKEE